MKNEAGEWTGISIELWRRIAEDLNVSYEYAEHDLEGMLEAVESGDAAAGVAATTMTAEREDVLDFTHPFYYAGLGIAVTPERGGTIMSVARRLFSLEFFQAILALTAVLLIVGVAVWLFERRRNREHFEPARQGTVP